MISRTHDLVAVTLVIYTSSIITIPHMGIATLLVAGGMTIMGAVAVSHSPPVWGPAVSVYAHEYGWHD